MKCCKCKEYEWSDSQEVVYTDPKTGEGYCLFHAPADKKGMSVAKFNEKIFERIQAALCPNAEKISCDLSGTIFPGTIFFKQEMTFPETNFKRAKFYGQTFFNKTNFGASVSFLESNFNKDANFGNVTFHGHTDFTGAHFHGFANFAQSRFESANFHFVQFQEVDFHDSQFNKEIAFTEVQTKGLANFAQTKFAECVQFEKSQFFGEVFFCKTRFNSNVHFIHTTFNKSILFEKSIHNIIHFHNCKFRGQTIFIKLLNKKCKLLTISQCTISPSAIIFQYCDPTCLDLTQQYDLTNIHFINSSWEKNGRIKACTEDQDEMLQPTRDFYQRMKAKYKVENNEYEASKWHIAEKEAQLKLLRQNGESRFLWTMLWLYKAVSRFGEDPLRAGSVLGGFVLLVWLLLGMGGIASSDLVIQGVGFSWEGVSNLGTVFMTMFKNVMLFKPESIAFKPLHDGINGLVLVLTRLVIPLLAALFAFALRNRFRR